MALLLANTTLKTINSGSVTIIVEDGSVFVNSAKVIIPNVLVANGVVHVMKSMIPLPSLMPSRYCRKELQNTENIICNI